jgi:hypothetical protein
MRVFAILALAVGLMGAAAAAPAKNAAAKDEMCAAGHGKAVCCKAGVADHCGYVSCCEVGNAGFFTSKSCSTCAKHRAEAARAAAKSCCAGESKEHAGHAGGNGYVSCCEEGNRAFFSQGCTMGAPKAACCAKEGKSAKKK